MILFLSFIITFLVLLILTKTRLASLIIDLPNHRSLHINVTPRSGGLAIMMGVTLGFLLLNDHLWLYLIYFLVIISFLDDRFDLHAKWRFLAHVLVAGYFVWKFIPAPVGLKLVFVLLLTWMINLYNFMDGSDGLAGGMAIFGFSTYAVGFHLAELTQFAILCAAIVYASCAFLMFNFHPAKIFMGDVGSIPLGFLAGSLGIYGYYLNCWSIWFPILVFSPFIVDATVTLIKRIFRRQKVWQAHREHYYQRLVQLGWGHCKTAFYEYCVMFGCSISALFELQCPEYGLWLISLWMLIYMVIALWIDRQWKLKLHNNLG